MKWKSVAFIVIIFLCIISPAIVAGNTCRLTIHILGLNDYQPHDETVLLRYYKKNESAPVLYSVVSDENGVAVLNVKAGEYWVDVRNIWYHVAVDEDLEFTFPYKIYGDINTTEKPDVDIGDFL